MSDVLTPPVSERRAIFERLMQERQELPGDIAEFGVYGGGCTRQLARYGRTVYAFDTFSGMPEQDIENMDVNSPTGNLFRPGDFRPPLSVDQMFKGFPNIVPIIGRFADTLPAFRAGIQFALVFLDCDLYRSHVQALDWLVSTSRLLPGTALVCDDWGFLPGAGRAIEEFASRHRVRREKGRLTLVWLGGER